MRGRFWRDFTNVVTLGEAGDQRYQSADGWRIRSLLARHFCMHIESLMPGQSGDRVAVLALWLSEKVASIFDPAFHDLSQVRDSIVQQSAPSQEVRMLTHSVVTPSDLRYSTVYTPSPWGISLISQVGEQSTASTFGFHDNCGKAARRLSNRWRCSNRAAGFLPRQIEAVPTGAVRLFSADFKRR